MAESMESVNPAKVPVAAESTAALEGSGTTVDNSAAAAESTLFVGNSVPAQSSTAHEPPAYPAENAAHAANTTPAENTTISRDSIGSFLVNEGAAVGQMDQDMAVAEMENKDLAADAGMEEKDTVDAHIVSENTTGANEPREEKTDEAATNTKEDPEAEGETEGEEGIMSPSAAATGGTPIKRCRMSFSKMPILACVKIYHPRPASLPLDDENANVRLLGRVASVPRPSKGVHHYTLQWTKAAKDRYEEMYVDETDFYDDEDREKAQIVTRCEGNERNKRLLREALVEANKLSQEELRAALVEMDESYGKRLKQSSRPPGRPRKITTPTKSPTNKKKSTKSAKKAATPTRKRGRPRKLVVEQESEDDDDDTDEDESEEEVTTPTPRKRGRPRKTPPKKATPKKRVAAKKKASGRKKATAKKGKATMTKTRGGRSKKKAVPPSARKKRTSSK